jgi:hypothetical protein
MEERFSIQHGIFKAIEELSSKASNEVIELEIKCAMREAKAVGRVVEENYSMVFARWRVRALLVAREKKIGMYAEV